VQSGSGGDAHSQQGGEGDQGQATSQPAAQQAASQPAGQSNAASSAVQQNIPLPAAQLGAASPAAQQKIPSPTAQPGSGADSHSQQGGQGDQGQAAASPAAGSHTASDDTSQMKSNPGPTSPDRVLGLALTTESKNSGDSTWSDLASKSATLKWGVDRVRPYQGDVLSRVRGWDTRLAAEAASIMRSMWKVTEDAVETASSQETDVLAESLPFDPAVLDRAIEHYLNRIDAFGNTLADLLRGDGAWPWLAGAVAASAAGALAYQRARKHQSEPIALVDDEGTISSWFLDSTSNG
jgi:hypothetical protein